MKRINSTFLIFITAIGFSLFFPGCRSQEPTRVQAPIRVEAREVKPANYQAQISYSGTIEESVSISLSFPIPGMVDRVMVRQGQKVRKGELLATVNGDSYKNAYELALAKQKQAEDAYRRFEPMFKNSTMPEIKMVEIETGLKQSTAAAEISKKNWDDCKLVAPVDGVIGKRSIEPGMNVLPGVPVLTLVQIEKVYVRFPVPENEVSRIKNDQMAEIKIPALGTDLYHGKVEEIGVIANILSRSYDAKIGLPNPSGDIRPGMVCNVRLMTDEKTSYLVVPNQAVQVDDNGNHFVFVADTKNNKAQKRKITVGPLLTDGICVTGGLETNEKVIVSGSQKLADNSAISIIR